MIFLDFLLIFSVFILRLIAGGFPFLIQNMILFSLNFRKLSFFVGTFLSSVIGISVLLVGVNLVLMYGLTFFSGISLFFGSAMLIAGIDLKRKIKKFNAKNRKAQQDYTISKLLEDEDDTKESDMSK